MNGFCEICYAFVQHRVKWSSTANKRRTALFDIFAKGLMVFMEQKAHAQKIYSFGWAMCSRRDGLGKDLQDVTLFVAGVLGGPCSGVLVWGRASAYRNGFSIDPLSNP